MHITYNPPVEAGKKSAYPPGFITKYKGEVFITLANRTWFSMDKPIPLTSKQRRTLERDIIIAARSK